MLPFEFLQESQKRMLLTVFVRKVNWFNIQTQCAVFVALLFYCHFMIQYPQKKTQERVSRLYVKSDLLLFLFKKVTGVASVVC